MNSHASYQREVEKESGLHVRHYQKLEEGIVNVTIGTIERLSKGFGVGVRQLFERYETT